MITLCGANWCKDAPELNVSSALQKQIDAKKQELEINDTHDSDPYQQEMVLCNMQKLCIFGQKGKVTDDCRQRTIYYQDIALPCVNKFLNT